MKVIIKKKMILLNIIVPLLIGGILYLISSPNVIFVEFINVHIKNISPVIKFDSMMGKFLRNYIADILWGYSLQFAIYFILDEEKIWKLFIAAFVFSTFFEGIQIFNSIPGTFDAWDILFEGIAEIIAAININNMRRQKSYEK